MREAQELEARGAREINLVAQDLGHYGRDLPPGGPALPDLLRALLRRTGVPWFRLLYVYSAGITPALIELLASEPRLVPYLDMPIQHACDRLLALMRRPERQESLRRRVRLLREAVPGIAVRTTALVGFPTETDEDFRQLLEFVDEMRFDRLGAFAYSPQEGTRAADLPDDVPDAVKQDRLAQLLELQRAVSAERLTEYVGQELEVLVDEGAGPDDPGQLVARAPFQADDVDGCTWLRTERARAPGDFVRVRVTDALDYDLVAVPAG